jgi:hypothetical protein
VEYCVISPYTNHIETIENLLQSYRQNGGSINENTTNYEPSNNMPELYNRLNSES